MNPKNCAYHQSRPENNSWPDVDCKALILPTKPKDQPANLCFKDEQGNQVSTHAATQSNTRQCKNNKIERN
jgi:hypothetical protein